MAWDEAKRQAARERMAHARSVRMAKLSHESHSSVAVLDQPLAPVVPSVARLAPDLTLTVRRLRVGSFSGLWELCRVEKDGTVVVVSDANTKQIIIGLARREIAKCGQ